MTCTVRLGVDEFSPEPMKRRGVRLMIEAVVRGVLRIGATLERVNTPEQDPSRQSSQQLPSHVDIWARTAIQASPRFAGALSVLYDGYRARWSSRAADVVAEIAQRCSPEQLQTAIAESEGLEAAFVRAMEAGSTSTLAAKRRLLGKVIAQAVLDDAQVDEASLITTVLAQVDAPHMRCLEAVNRAKQAALAAGELGPIARGAEQEINQRVVDAGKEHPAPLLAQLVSWGLLDASVSWDGEALVKGPTAFGERVLADLRQA